MTTVYDLRGDAERADFPGPVPSLHLSIVGRPRDVEPPPPPPEMTARDGEELLRDTYVGALTHSATEIGAVMRGLADPGLHAGRLPLPRRQGPHRTRRSRAPARTRRRSRHRARRLRGHQPVPASPSTSTTASPTCCRPASHQRPPPACSAHPAGRWPRPSTCSSRSPDGVEGFPHRPRRHGTRRTRRTTRAPRHPSPRLLSGRTSSANVTSVRDEQVQGELPRRDVGILDVRVVGIWMVRRIDFEVDAFARTVLSSVDRVTLEA